MTKAARTNVTLRLLGAVAGLCVVACGGDQAEPEPGNVAPWPDSGLADVVEPADNPTTEAKRELGRLLFYDPVLSTDRLTACATCHSEIWGMSDGLDVSVGVDGEGPTGPGRVGPNKTRRNAQTLWNVGYRQNLFWDGRSTSLEDQALEPLRTPEELGRDPAEAAAEIATIPAYAKRFAAAFDGAKPTPTTIAKALAAFQRTMISRRAPYDRFVAGDDGALSDETKLGMQRFADAGCPTCHTAPLFDSERFVDRGLAGDDDKGRAEVTDNPADTGRFRVPTLRNVRESGPFFHDGSAETLLDAVRHEVSLVPSERGVFDAEDVRLITQFLDKALTDRTSEPARPDEVPSGLPVPQDGFRIPR